MAAPDGERIAVLEAQGKARGEIIQELRADLKEIRTLILAINSKLSSITYDQSTFSHRLEETHAVAMRVSQQVAEITKEDEHQKMLVSVATRYVIPAIAAVGSLGVMIYQFRYAIGEFLRKVFG